MERDNLEKSDVLKKIQTHTEKFGTILWETLTPFERERVLNRIIKQLPTIESKYNLDVSTSKLKDTSSNVKDSKQDKSSEINSKQVPKTSEPIQSPRVNADPFPFERSVWDIKTLYQVAHQDMIEQRTTIMKFLLDNYGIEAVETFFLNQNPQWAEQLKVGKMKKIFAKIISKLAPRTIMNKLADIIIENAQYLVPLENITINEASDNYKIIEITKCPVLKEFKKTLKTLKFTNLEERYVCTFACVPVLAQMASVGNCDVSGDYYEKGCRLKVSLKAKAFESLNQSEAENVAPVRNGPSK